MFAVIFNVEGKHYLTGTLKAAEIISLGCFEAPFTEESHIPVPQGWAGCQRWCRAGPCLTDQELWVLAPLEGCWQGQPWEWEGKGGPTNSGWLGDMVVAEQQ